LAQGEKTELKLILKSDGPSSLEALKYALDSLTPPENVVIKKVHSDVGNFTDSDLSLAKASDSLLIGFNITMNVAMKKKADQL
jgi:translation initiation factor IF-2